MIAEEITNLDIEGGYAYAISLNNEQQFAYDTIMEKVDSELSGIYFIDGPGGMGKNFLYDALLAGMRSQNLVALATASSRVSVSLLPESRAVHSRFKIPLETDGEVSCSVSKQSALEILLKMSKLILWDEALMVNPYTIEAVDKMLKYIIDCSLPFGGKVVVLGGDFRQVLPVISRGEKEDIIRASLVFSDLWPLYSHLPLIFGEIYTYYNFDEAIDKSEQSLQEDFLNTLTLNGIPPY
ncbi:uncharacterized protein LOC111376961 [Olea europaea var. sylvestris]|uniref:uncharacterized protein LOC111376961 n=1 Tax=Olea europaea var. sylvestris TaxID=158386 RepID=UPI000C1D36D4|nr:uncharacterized protein LOC111376961 [Olea europaea var. sylvestris]